MAVNSQSNFDGQISLRCRASITGANDRRWIGEGPKEARAAKCLSGAIALMAGETVIRILRMIVDHQAVARYLGDNRSCSDTKTLAIAANNRGLWKIETRDAPSVGEHVIRLGASASKARRLAAIVAQ